MKLDEMVSISPSGVHSVKRAFEESPAKRVRVRRWPNAVFVPLCFVWVLIGSATQARAQSVDQIKAAFLFNFARYVEWPEAAFADPSSGVRICLVGAKDFASVVSSTVSGKSVGDRPVEVTRENDLLGVSACHILYVGDDVQASPAEVAKRIGHASVFTVGDRSGFAIGGGMANFIRADNKVRFEINPAAAKKAGLKVSSRLLRLAKVVESTRP